VVISFTQIFRYLAGGLASKAGLTTSGFHSLRDLSSIYIGVVYVIVVDKKRERR